MLLSKQGMLLAQLKSGTSNRLQTTWPGTDVAIELRVLCEQDYLDAGLSVDKIYNAAGIRVGMENVSDYEAEKTTQLLYRAILDPETHVQAFGTIGEFRQALRGQGVKEQLMADLEQFTRTCSPRVAELSGEEVEALLARLKKTPEVTAMSVSSIALLRSQTQHEPAQQPSSPMGSGSTSSP